jgi:DNA-binding beta-propeller fold protein YncE
MLPHGVWVLPDGRVLVADRENDRIQFFSPDGEYLEEWTDVRRPCSILTDDAGLVYVVELSSRAGRRSYVHGVDEQPRPGRVSVFSPHGELRARWGNRGTAPGEFVAPHGIAVDSRGDLYVSEVTWTLYGRVGEAPDGYRQIQKFTRAPAES